MSRKSKAESVGVKPRDPAPPIRLMSYNATRSKVLDQVRLSDYLNRYVLLLFFPDNTPTCHSEYESFSESVGWFADRGCVVMGVAVASARDIARLKQYKLSFTMLCDEDGAVSRSYGMFDAKQGTAHRGLVILDKNHKVRHVALTHRSCSRSVRECIGIVDALVWQDRIENGGHVVFPGDVVPKQADRNRRHTDDATATLRETTTIEPPTSPRPTNFTTTKTTTSTTGTSLGSTSETITTTETTSETSPTSTKTPAKSVGVKFASPAKVTAANSPFANRPTPNAAKTTTIIEIPESATTSSTEISSATTITNTTSIEETPSTFSTTTDETRTQTTSMRRSTTTTSKTTSSSKTMTSRIAKR